MAKFRVPYGYIFLGAYNTKKEAMKAIGHWAYRLHAVRHGDKKVYYAYVLKG